jgi:hypothetical protein
VSVLHDGAFAHEMSYSRNAMRFPAAATPVIVRRIVSSVRGRTVNRSLLTNRSAWLRGVAPAWVATSPETATTEAAMSTKNPRIVEDRDGLNAERRRAEVCWLRRKGDGKRPQRRPPTRHRLIDTGRASSGDVSD